MKFHLKFHITFNLPIPTSLYLIAGIIIQRFPDGVFLRPLHDTTRSERVENGAGGKHRSHLVRLKEEEEILSPGQRSDRPVEPNKEKPHLQGEVFKT